MLDLGSDPNLRDSNGWTALHYACQLGDLQSVVILREKGANIDAYSNNKRIPLHLAALHGYSEIVQFLLEKALKSPFLSINILTDSKSPFCAA
jgi:ankyrin repeat protein